MISWLNFHETVSKNVFPFPCNLFSTYSANFPCHHQRQHHTPIFLESDSYFPRNTRAMASNNSEKIDLFSLSLGFYLYAKSLNPLRASKTLKPWHWNASNRASIFLVYTTLCSIYNLQAKPYGLKQSLIMKLCPPFNCYQTDRQIPLMGISRCTDCRRFCGCVHSGF